MGPAALANTQSLSGSQTKLAAQEQRALFSEPKYQLHGEQSSYVPSKVSDAYRSDEFQIYNDYVRRMTQRHQLIIENAKRDRIQCMMQEDTAAGSATSLERIKQREQQ